MLRFYTIVSSKGGGWYIIKHLNLAFVCTFPKKEPDVQWLSFFDKFISVSRFFWKD